MIRCRLREILKRKGWSRYKLQQMTGITYPTLHALFHERNKGYRADVLNKLRYALKCTAGDLLSGDRIVFQEPNEIDERLKVHL
jgi:DNA-binding Xre family transcriptional regulator